MPRKSSVPLKKEVIRLRDGDKEVLQQFYPKNGYNAVVRQLVANHVDQLKEREARVLGETGVGTIDLDPDLADCGDQPGEHLRPVRPPT